MHLCKRSFFGWSDHTIPTSSKVFLQHQIYLTEVKIWPTSSSIMQHYPTTPNSGCILCSAWGIYSLSHFHCFHLHRRQTSVNGLFIASYSLVLPAPTPNYRIRNILWPHFGESTIRGATFAASSRAIPTCGAIFTASTRTHAITWWCFPVQKSKHANWRPRWVAKPAQHSSTTMLIIICLKLQYNIKL